MESERSITRTLMINQRKPDEGPEPCIHLRVRVHTVRCTGYSAAAETVT